MSNNKWSKRFAWAAAVAALMGCQAAFAGETVELSLADAMDRAFKTNPAVSIANYGVQSSKASYDAARSSYGISISGKHNTGRGGANNEQMVMGTTKHDLGGGLFVNAYDPTKIGYTKGIGNQHTNSLTASMPLFSGGELEGTNKKAKAGYKYALAGQQKSFNQLRADVTNGYFTLLQAENAKMLSQESVDRMTDHLKNVQAQYDVGVVAKVDLLRSQVELANAKQTYVKAANARDLAEAALNRIVGLPMATSLKLDNIMVYKPYEESLENCLLYAEDHRPELAQAKYNVDAQKGALQVARSGHMPKVGLEASQSFYDANKSWHGSGEKNNWAVGVGVTMNIFDSGVTLSKIHGAEADLHSAEETYRDTKDAVALDVRNNYLSLREAEKRIETTETAVEQAEEDYRIAQLRYQAGVGTNTDVIDASVALTNAKNNYLQALYDYNTSKTNLQNAMGEPMVAPFKVKVDPAKVIEKTLKNEPKG